jgi:hypothetical protein
VGEIEGVLALREPRLLRDVALAPENVRDRYVRSVPKLMSRTFAPDEFACVKATSFASEIAPQLVPLHERALFVYAQPRNYVATILAGENSVKELRSLEQMRAQRLSGRDITFRVLRNDAERAAAAWACEMTTLEAAEDAMPDRNVEWSDFDALLLDLPHEIGRIAAFFGLNVTDDRLQAIAASPLINRYSKDPSYAYSPDLRHQLIDQEFRLQGREIDSALAMLSDAAEKSPLLTRALRRAKGA